MNKTVINAESEKIDKEQAKIGVTLKPPVSCKADLLALEEAGYEIDTVLRAAWRKVGPLVITEHFSPHDPDKDWPEHTIHVTRSIARTTLEAIREDANDIGLLSNAALVRGQLQPIWAETLETFITNLKKRL